MLHKLHRLALIAGQRSDVVIAAFMMLSVVMMILPLPTSLIDILIGFSITFSLLMMIVAFYVSRPVEFSALPSVLLLATLFRLALSISTTRLILSQADAGEIVQAFGEFVIGGELVIGLVIFFIITLCQFIVITKGAERVAEVAARFSLDAMPGKQMSIDNDLRNGDIDAATARQRRTLLERESQLFGAMDGAMKFIKGDAIAGFIILAVNLLGGLVIGVMEKGMSFAEAAHTYSLLSVGDGLVALLPSLLTALAAGILVTRVSPDGQRDLGSEMITQLGRNAQALGLTAMVLLGLALVPGFPAPTFLLLAALLGGIAWLSRRRQKSIPTGEQAAEAVNMAAQASAPSPGVVTLQANGSLIIGAPPCRIVMRLSSDLAATITPPQVQSYAESARERYHADSGLLPVGWQFYVDDSLEPESFRIELDGVPINSGTLPTGRVCLMASLPDIEQVAQWDVREGTPLRRRLPSRWLAPAEGEQALALGLKTVSLEQVVVRLVLRAMRSRAPDFLGMQETSNLLSQQEAFYPELVKEALRLVPIARMAQVLRHLLEEGLPVNNMRALLEAFVEWGGVDSSSHALAEHVRGALARQICHRFADHQNTLHAYLLDKGFEGAIRQRLDEGHPLLPPEWIAQLTETLRASDETRDRNLRPVLVTRPELRRYLWRLLRQQALEIPVIAYGDIQYDYRLTPLLSIDPPPELAAQSYRQQEAS
ncbi:MULTISPECIES: type III secretion system export apparatus subunit SctV [Klebsiella/Raoultella group]|uniref:type III secretion system export apparatus subunit SctV n=1 Tax=Klebsiella/Raoultella group TaxID=2890311 RepID=UPI00100A1FCA|nr:MULTISPECIES: type III secretion system export apparatus subunit SctV [Klebsiella/Raoultella group]QAV82129.1 EscV/YscV/HrcV family type III secretion system export apparatus protein [Klebsiella pneumoniae]WFW02019.1 type III secretion system export apparatus subunit SctV [Klebsiella aerogenes]WSI11156.1 type III secretion system export apparatus subunit SctV [Klebsiella pneumoniae]